MTAADLPPSSSVHRAMRSAHKEAMRLPAALEPVKLILSTPGCRTSASDACRWAVTTLRTPGGKPTDPAISATMYAAPGASGDALIITVQPVSNAGATL